MSDTAEVRQFEIRPETWTTGGRGPATEGRPVRFIGQLVATMDTKYPDAQAWWAWTVYRTSAGRIILVSRYGNIWEGSHNSVEVRDYPDISAVPTWPDGEDEGAGLPDWAHAEAEEALGVDPARIIE